VPVVSPERSPGDDRPQGRRAAVRRTLAGAIGAVVPPRAKARNLVERFLNKVKDRQRMATRYDKTDRNFMAFWQLASIIILLT